MVHEEQFKVMLRSLIDEVENGASYNVEDIINKIKANMEKNLAHS